MHLLRLNGRVPRMNLGSSFWRDLLYMAAWLQKKWRDKCYTDFYTGRNLTNEVTTSQHWYMTYCCCNIDRNHIMGKWQLHNQDQQSWLHICWCKKARHTGPGKLPLHMFWKEYLWQSTPPSPLGSHTPMERILIFSFVHFQTSHGIWNEYCSFSCYDVMDKF